MFGVLSILAVFILPLVSALTLQVPVNPTSGGQVTIRWTSDAGDPDTFSLELINEAFHDSFAIANNVDPSAGQLTLTLPVVPVRDGYTLQAVNIGNITDVYATTSTFSIGASTASVASTTKTGTGTSTSTLITTRSSLTQPTTVIVTTSSALAPIASSTDTSIATAPAASPSKAAAASSRPGFDFGGIVTVTFSVVAGVVVLAL